MHSIAIPAVSAPNRSRLVAAARIGAAALVGFGLILWIAANWADLGKWARFAIVGGAVALPGLAAMAFPVLRAPGSLLAFCATGGLLALFGQTYQTGADPWTLFAIWALLGVPWSLAARNDAVWTATVLVAFTALGLWIAAGASLWTRAPVDRTLAGWSIGFLIVLAAWGLRRVETWAGHTRWAARLATVMLAALLVTYALPALFGQVHTVYWVGLTCVAVGLVLLRFARPLDLSLLTLLALGFDTLLIAGIARALISGFRNVDLGAILFTGLLSAAVVAATAMALLRIARADSGDDDARSVRALATSRWPIAVLTGLGALLAAVPLWIFYGLAFATFMKSPIGAFALGLVTIAGALALLHRADGAGFRAQLGFIALLTGLGVTAFGSIDGLRATNGSLVMTVMLAALAIAIGVAWIRGLLGAGSVAFVTVAVLAGIDARWFGLPPLVVAGIAIAGALGLVLADGTSEGRLRAAFAPYARGWAAAAIAIAIAASGSTFLFGAGLMPIRGSAIADLAPWNGFALAKTLSVACALAACGLVLVRRPDTRTTAGYGVAAVAILLSLLASTLGPILLLGAAAIAVGARALAVFAAVGALWAVGAVYYQLALPLATKGLVLAVAGTVLGLLAALGGGSSGMGAPRPADRARATVFIALGLLATAGAVGASIVEKEGIIRDGRRVYVRLGPVDPRSLMQGDYMALRFALPAGGRVADETGRVQAVGTLDANGVVGLARIESAPATLAPGEIAIDLRAKNGAWIIASDAWFFREGTGDSFARARFGEFRLLGDGRVLLVGLADADLKPIR